MIKIAPSILSADFASMGSAVEKLEQMGADYVHIDVMDGHFVPNITFGPAMVKAIKKHTRLKLDVHLMIENPEKYTSAFIDAGADILTVHSESTYHVQRLLDSIQKSGVKAGIALNPATPLNVIDYITDVADMILIMTVNPGFGGQKFIPAMVDKVKSLKSFIDKKKSNLDIEVDGGINTVNIRNVIDAGANVIVAGSAIFNSNDPQNVIRQLRGDKN